MQQSQEHEKKHPCRDCKFCQWCSDERCRLCRRDTAPVNSDNKCNSHCDCDSGKD